MAQSPDLHPGGAKRLNEAMQDYSLTMQHALRQNLENELVARANAEAGVLPPLTAVEMFHYLSDTDDEFYNWCFPFCAFKLTKDNLGYLHRSILDQFLRSITPDVPNVVQSAN